MHERRQTKKTKIAADLPYEEGSCMIQYCIQTKEFFAAETIAEKRGAGNGSIRGNAGVSGVSQNVCILEAI